MMHNDRSLVSIYTYRLIVRKLGQALKWSLFELANYTINFVQRSTTIIVYTLQWRWDGGATKVQRRLAERHSDDDNEDDAR